MTRGTPQSADLDERGSHPAVRRHYERRGMLALLAALADVQQDYRFFRDEDGEVAIREIQGRTLSAENLMVTLRLDTI